MILGINYTEYHDSSVTLITAENRIALAISEERVSRVKKDGAFPRNCLDLIDLNSVEAVAIPNNERLPNPAKRGATFTNILFPQIRSPSVTAEEWAKQLEALNKKIYFFDHHLSHAAAALHLSGFSDAVIFVSDYCADNSSLHTAFYEFNNKISDQIVYTCGEEISSSAPICAIYTFATALLGFMPNHHEGKLTGMAAHAAPDSSLQERLINTFLNDHRVPSLMNWSQRFTSNSFPELVVDESIRLQLRDIFLDHSDLEIASAAQAIIETQAIKTYKQFVMENPNASRNLILSGGLFANVKLNMELNSIVNGDLFVSPVMGDEGNSLGAALLCNNAVNKTPINSATPPENLYFGPQRFQNNSIKTLRSIGKFRKTKNLFTTLANILSEGKNLAVMRGKMEFGPRALGNTSILNAANDIRINQILNDKLKRNEYMPFAPIIRYENAVEYFEDFDINKIGHSAKFMTICVKASSALEKLCPAVVHVDGTCRPQLVTETSNPFLYKLLSRYETLTGLPVLINTSFNIHEEPIINDAFEALRSTFQSQLDYLLLDDELISLEENEELLQLFNSLNYLAKDRKVNHFKNNSAAFFSYKNKFLELERNYQRLETYYKNLMDEHEKLVKHHEINQKTSTIN